MIALSVVIPTFNAARTLGDCLAALPVDRPDVEVIVVDQNSTDGTPEIAAAHGATLVERPAPEFYSPPTASRNAGAAVATGAVLYHLDSDMAAEDGLVDEIVQRMADATMAGLIVHERDVTGGFWSRCKAYERALYWGDDRFEAARVMRRSAFEAIGGYDEDLSSGEDWDIHRRLATVGDIGWCDHVVHHDLRGLRLRRLISKKFSYGRTASAFLDKHDEGGGRILARQLGLFARNLGPARRTPLVAAGSLVLKVLEYGAGGVGLVTARALAALGRRR